MAPPMRQAVAKKQAMPVTPMKRPAAADAAPGASRAKQARTGFDTPRTPRSPYVGVCSPVSRAVAFSSSAAKSIGNDYEAKIVAAEKRAEKAEQELAGLQERAKLLQQCTDKVEASNRELAEANAKAAARAARAEGRAEVLQEQTTNAATALERAIRAEEQVAVLGDVQSKLPSLVQAVVGTLAYSQHFGFHGGLGPVKLEFDAQGKTGEECQVEFLEKATPAKVVESGKGTEAEATRQPGLMQRVMGAAVKGASGRRRAT